MAAKLKRPELDHERPAEESWERAEADPAVDEDHELPSEEPKYTMLTPMPAD